MLYCRDFFTFMKKFLQVVFYGVFALAFAWVSLQLFFQRETEAFLASLFSVSEVSVSEESVRIVVAEPAASLEPLSLNAAVRQRTENVYEALVALDSDLSYKPGLALAFGRVSPLVWEFRLRPDVKFHDGSDFGVEDVLASYESARKNGDLKALLSGVKKVEAIDQWNLRVTTARPDPLLLSRFAKLLIFPSEGDFVGTGPYAIENVSEKELKLVRFADYWGDLPYFREVVLEVAVDKNERVRLFVDGEADLLSFVPFDAVEFLESKGFEVSALPSLEVQFLLLNFDSELFGDLQKRAAFAAAIDQSDLVAAVGGFAREASQFVSNGVFGFNPDLKARVYDEDAARELARESELAGETLEVHLQQGLSVLGEHIRLQMKEVGVNAVISYLANADLLASFAAKEADVYFLGFKAESGDSADFFRDIVVSGADFNLGNYRNSEVDDLIEAAAEELVVEERLGLLREVSARLDEDVFGVPLFEYESLYAAKEGIEFEVRIDGFIDFKSLR